MGRPPASGGSASFRGSTLTLIDTVALRVARFADSERMFRRTNKVLVALSGGPDSTAALLVLLKLRDRLGFEVVACHFDHQLRDSSATDMESVRGLCATLGVECYTGEGDVRGVAKQQKQGLEVTARTMRYQFLAFVSGKELADAIVTGHTADDQAETVLMRVVRGSGVRGIRGMLPVSGVPGSEAQRLLRPLLVVTRAETVAICQEAGAVPLADPTNDDPRFTRNRVRNETLRALREVNPSVQRAILGLAESARALFEPVEKQVMSLVPIERGPVGAIFPTGAVAALAAEGITLLLEREAGFYKLTPDVNRTRLENVRNVLTRGTGRVHFGEAEVEASSGRVRVGPRLESVEPFEPAALNVPGSTRAGPWRVDVSTESFESPVGVPVVAIDVGGQKGALRARPVLPGDRIWYRGMERKLSDVLVNAKLPTWERQGMVAIADSRRVLGLFGATTAIGEAAPGEGTLHVRLTQLPAR